MKINERIDGQPKHREGSAKVAAALGLARFPAEKTTLESKFGSWKIPLGEGKTVNLSDLLEAVPQERFEDHTQAINAIDHHWREVVAKAKAAKAPKPAKAKKAAKPLTPATKAKATPESETENEE